MTLSQDKWLSVSLDERVAILEEMRLVLWSPGFAQEVRPSNNSVLAFPGLLPFSASFLPSFLCMLHSTAAIIVAINETSNSHSHQMVHASCRAKGFDPLDPTMAPLVAEEWLMCASALSQPRHTTFFTAHAAPARLPGP